MQPDSLRDLLGHFSAKSLRAFAIKLAAIRPDAPAEQQEALLVEALSVLELLDQASTKAQ